MSVLTQAPFSLIFDQVVKVKVRSVNAFGTSQWSDYNSVGAQIRSVPSQMGPLSVISKTETEITFAWSELTGALTGNSAIISYNLYWDDNTGVVNKRLASGQMLNFTVSGTTGGLPYQYKVSATNIYGEGQASEVLVSLASDVPDLITVVTTSINGNNVVVQWVAPFDNYKPILEYNIIFLTRNGQYVQASECSG